MYVILEADGKIYRMYDTIGDCWNCDLIRPRRLGWTYWDFYRTIQRGETAACPSFFVRKSKGAEDVANYEQTKAEWDAALHSAQELKRSREMGYIRDMSADDILKLPTLNLDDTFEFTCKACGKCCKNRHDILLSPYDLFRIASHLGRTPQEILERYCEVYEGDTSHMPVVRVLPVAPDNACPFLRGKRCSVHSKKPVVCRVFPLGRLSGGEDGGVRYVFSGSGCNHEPKSVTVREWLADVATEEAEQAAKLWGEVLTAIYPMIKPHKSDSPELREQMLTIFFGAIYLAYDMNSPFTPQLRDNFENLKTVFAEIRGDGANEES